MADLAKKYTPKTFPHLKGLKGISDGVLESHFKLYEGYVNRTNKLTETLYGLAKEGQASGANPAYAEMTRRLGFEYNGMVLHEYYFAGMKPGGSGNPGSKLKTDARNVRSRNAIERLGARFDGILRAAVLAADGVARDTAYYSILAAEWPEVRGLLEEKLARGAPAVAT